MHKYPETRDASSELFRLVVPMMRNHPAGFHPASYALWYEYAAGTNPQIKQAVDKLLACGEAITDEVTYALSEKHLASNEHPATEKMRAQLERMLAELSTQAGTAGEHAEAYGASLANFGASLKPDANPQEMQSALNAMTDDTLAMRDTAGQLQAQLQGSAQEIESLRAELTRVKSEAVTDPMTGITNRRGFERAIHAIHAESADQPTGFCLLMLDIDHFKKCNDTYGHLFGDKVIRGVAQALAKNVKGQDTAARIGGEEFAVLLPTTPLEGARVLAERIRGAIAQGRIKSGTNGELIGNITISVGVAQYVAGETVDAIMARADKALYASKSGGRNRVTIAAPPETAETADAAANQPGRPAPMLRVVNG